MNSSYSQRLTRAYSGEAWSSMIEADKDGLRTADRFVYSILAHYANPLAFPGRDLVVAITGYAPETVSRSLGDLERRGLIECVQVGNQHQVSKYRVVSHDEHVTPGSLATEGEHVTPVSEHVTPVSEHVTPSAGACNTRVTREYESDIESKRETLGGDAAEDELPFDLEVLPAVAPRSTSRAPDPLWEVFVEIHGEPGTKDERGKFNKAVGKLREAGVDPEEYPNLIAAYLDKNPSAAQPAPMTVATRVGELRHYLKQGPLSIPSKADRDLDAWGT